MLKYRISCSHVADGKKLTRTDADAKCLLLLSIVTELKFGRQILGKKTVTQNFTKILLAESKLFHEDMTKQVVAFAMLRKCAQKRKI